MADELLNALLGLRESPSNTGYGIATRGVGAALPMAINPYGSPGANLGIAVGGSLLASILGGMAKQSAAEETAARSELAQQLLATTDNAARKALIADRPEMQPLLTALQAQERERAAERAKKLDDISLSEQSDYRKAKNKALLDAMVAQGKLPVGSGGVIDFQEIGLEDPVAYDSRREAELKKAGFQAEVDAAGFNPKKADAAEKLRKEFNALEPVKNFANVERSARIIEKALKDPGAVADQELVRYGILLIEPGMAVREGEQAALANSASIPDEWRAEMAKALNGESGLSPKTREGIKRLAMRAYEGHKVSYDRAFNFYQNRAAEMGIDPESISFIGKAQPLDSVFPSDQNRGTNELLAAMSNEELAALRAQLAGGQ